MSDTEKAKSLPGWIQDHLQRYQQSAGADGHLWDARLGGGTGMIPTLLLTTIGRKSGRAITLPLIYSEDGGACVIVASKGGAPEHPAWYLNLLDRPEVEVQVADRKFRARARTASGAERARLWTQLVALYALYADYQKRTEREIPVVVLDPV